MSPLAVAQRYFELRTGDGQGWDTRVRLEYILRNDPQRPAEAGHPTDDEIIGAAFRISRLYETEMTQVLHYPPAEVTEAVREIALLLDHSTTGASSGATRQN